MAEHEWYPCARDQEFGARLAADERLLDRVLADLDAMPLPLPRAGGKAPVGDGARLPYAPIDVWARFTSLRSEVASLRSELDCLRGEVDRPVTVAAALEGATEARRPPST